MDYFKNRKVVVEKGGQILATNVGVPQGSVLGPTLWNVMYDDVVEVPLPEGFKIIGFADEIAVVGKHPDQKKLIHRMNVALSEIDDWMEENGLQIAPEKTEATMLKYSRRPKECSIVIKGQQINVKKSVKYLGITLDSSVTYKRIQRKLALRIIRAYRTVSFEAATVVGSLHPIYLLAVEREEIYRCEPPRTPEIKKREREKTMTKWQQEWSEGDKGAWTRELIRDLRPWVDSKWGHTSYHLTQALTGHGSFGSYLHKIGKKKTDQCVYCEEEADTPEHTLFRCTRWERHRAEVTRAVETGITKNNLVPLMLRSVENWNSIAKTITTIIRTKEEDERR